MLGVEKKQCLVNPQTNKQIQEGGKKWTDLIDKKIMPIQTPCLNVNKKLTEFLHDLKAYKCEFTRDQPAQQKFYFNFFKRDYGDAFFVHFLNHLGIKCASEQFHIILQSHDPKDDTTDFEYGYRHLEMESKHALRYNAQCENVDGYEVILIRLGFLPAPFHILEIANTTMDPIRVSAAIKEYTSKAEKPLKIEKIWHRSAVLVNHTKKTVEYFEPHGHSAAHEPEASIGIQAYLLEDPRLTFYKYITATDNCPAVGVQSVTNDAFCQNWALLYIVLRLTNPSISSADVQRELISLSKEDLVNVIEGFMCYIIAYVRMYHLDTLMDWYRDFEKRKQTPEDTNIAVLILEGNYTQALVLVNKWKKRKEANRQRRGPGIMKRNKP